MTDFLQIVPPWVLIALVCFGAIMGTVAYLILLERKVAAWTQDRLGPNRVGPGGLLQPMADGLKFFLKEDYRPAGVDRTLFTLAPAVMMAVVLLTLAVIPWGGIHQRTVTADITGAVGSVVDLRADGAIPVNSTGYSRVEAEARQRIPLGASFYSMSNPRVLGGQVLVDVTYRYAFQIAHLNIGVLFLVAALSLAVYGIVLGGWASNNKYSFLGGLRATAQMISYEIPLGLSLLTIVCMFGTLELGEIVEKQAHYWGIGRFQFIPAWNVFTQPVAFLMFLICIHAEANRAPFDLAEAEQELVGGYHTEYSSMRFALFFLAEYAGMIATSAVCVALFFGGWHFPGLGGSVDIANPAITTSFLEILLRCAVFFGKLVFIIFVFMWVRWSLPRFRFDQLMMLAWRGMIPLSLALLMVTATVVYFFGPGHRAHMRISSTMALALLAANIVLVAAALIVSRLLPPPPPTNRRLLVAGSRFASKPLAVGS